MDCSNVGAGELTVVTHCCVSEEWKAGSSVYVVDRIQVSSWWLMCNDLSSKVVAHFRCTHTRPHMYTCVYKLVCVCMCVYIYVENTWKLESTMFNIIKISNKVVLTLALLNDHL